MISVRPGKRNRRIALLRTGPDYDDGLTTRDGGLMLLAERWASWMPANGRRTFENLGREAVSAGSFWLRGDPVTRSLVETDKIGFENRVWDITSVTEIGRREGIELIVTASDDYGEVDLSGLQPLPAPPAPTPTPTPGVAAEWDVTDW